MGPEGMVEILLHLDEPWRTRFLRLVACTVVSTWNSRDPTREELTRWLGEDIRLYRWTLQLLRAWDSTFEER